MKRYLIAFAILMASSSANAINWEMPPGTWISRTEKGISNERLALEIREGHRIKLTLSHPKGKTEPLVMNGKYEISITKFSDYHSDVQFESLTQKVQGEDRSLSEGNLIGVKIVPGERYSFIFNFDCSDGKNTVQLCIDPYHQPFCRNLERLDASCKGHAPAIDGSLINPPVNFDERK